MSETPIENLKRTIKKILLNVSKTLEEPLDCDKILIEDRGIPHERPKCLPQDYTAVYVFYCPKEEKFLKIGKVGPNSEPRFRFQHYSPKAAKSTLARSLLNDVKMTKKYNLSDNNIKQWIMENCYRIDILFPPSVNKFTNELCEACLHYKLKPRYEG